MMYAAKMEKGQGAPAKPVRCHVAPKSCVGVREGVGEAFTEW